MGNPPASAAAAPTGRDDFRRSKLEAFVGWCAAHVTGDEKGQAQVFLDRLFQAFGQPGSLDVGGEPEMRVRKAKEDGGGTAFADYVWKPVVLIEMKRRGVDLARHYRQAFDYWTRLVPDRPRYVVLCNFDRFDVYDFDRQLDTPVDSVALAELPTRYGPLAFLFPTNEKPTFGNDREAVTRDAAFRLAACFNKGMSSDVSLRHDMFRLTRIMWVNFPRDASSCHRQTPPTARRPDVRPAGGGVFCRDRPRAPRTGADPAVEGGLCKRHRP